MSITLLYGCVHIEPAVRDLDAARAFMQGVLGAEPIEERWAREIAELRPGGTFRVEHVCCGEAVFQFCQPARPPGDTGSVSVHETYLESVGPCVTNLNYFVDDVAHARALLAEKGAATRLEGPTSGVPCMVDYGPGNTREGEPSRFCFMGTRDLIGFDLELEEPHFKRLRDQDVHFPSFVHPRPTSADRVGRLLRQRVVVRDLERAYRNLCDVIAPASRSGAYGVRQGTLARAFRIALGGLELEYCQPLDPGGRLAQRLSERGPGVVSIEFGVRDLETFLRANAGSCEPEPDDLGLAGAERPTGPRHEIGSRDRVGFDIVVEPLGEAL